MVIAERLTINRSRPAGAIRQKGETKSMENHATKKIGFRAQSAKAVILAWAMQTNRYVGVNQVKAEAAA